MNRNIKVGDKVVCVDAETAGTQGGPVTEFLKKGKTYTVAGVSAPPHDTPDRPLIMVNLPRPHLFMWWKNWRFEKKGR